MTGKANDFPWTNIGTEYGRNIHYLNTKNSDHRWTNPTKRKRKGIIQKVTLGHVNHEHSKKRRWQLKSQKIQ